MKRFFILLSLFALTTAVDSVRAAWWLPSGLDQAIPLNHKGSYGTEIARIVDCPEEDDHSFGTCGNDLCGGVVMVGSHLEGSVRVVFSPPVDNVSHFQFFFGLVRGDDSTLTAPRLFGEFPQTGVELRDVPDDVSAGDLNLLTGEVTNLRLVVQVNHSAIQALAAVNGAEGAPPFQFPGEYGDVWARFEQRPDGLLDFTIRVSTFLPFGKDIAGEPIRVPVLPCLSPTACGSIPARGTSLHPHLHFSTKEPEGEPCAPNCPDIPFNTAREYTLFTHSSSIGDDFNLNVPELGGVGPARSHISGRLRIQFGVPTPIGTVPFILSAMLPKGLLGEPPESPLSFPGILPGSIAFDEFVPFPQQTYFLHGIGMADDPFDYAMGMIDLRTGRVIGEFLYRVFFAHNLLFAVFEANKDQIDPQSFRLRGPARFDRGVNGQTVFRLQSEAIVPLGTGFRFPTPEVNPQITYPVGPGSFLDIFVRLQAMDSTDTPRAVKTGGQTNVLSSTAERFSYSYSLPCDGTSSRPFFEYTNAARAATFRLRRLAAVTCTNSRTATAPAGDFDTVTFSAFGSWSGDSDPHLATGQISTSSDFPYVGIQIDGGLLSNVNTRPAERPAP